jgi:hypothetical protein
MALIIPEIGPVKIHDLFSMKSFRLSQSGVVVMFSLKIVFFFIFILKKLSNVRSDGVLGCGGFVKSDVDINFSLVEVSKI